MNDSIRQIDLSDFVLFGGGFMGESYNHRHNPDIMLKLYSPERADWAIRQHECAMQAYASGIPTPEPWRHVRRWESTSASSATAIPISTCPFF